jgi:thiamine transport system substrate-binding protein
MFVYPVNETAVLPPVFAQHSTIPAQPALLEYAQIAANREAWVRAWTDVALR